MTTLYKSQIDVVEEDWFAIDLESKLNKKIDMLQMNVNQQSEMIQQMSSNIKQLKSELYSMRQLESQQNHTQQSEILQQLSDEIKMLKNDLHTAKHQSHSQNDRTHQLLEELKVLKQRELNLALRVHTPVPFTAIPNSFFMTHLTKDLKSPLFKSMTESNKPPAISL